MNHETSPLLKPKWMAMAMKTRPRIGNGNDDYSSIASFSSQATTVTSTAISSSENMEDSDEPVFVNHQGPGEQVSDTNKTDGTLVMDIEEAIDRLGMGMFHFQIVLACGLCFASDCMEYLLLSYLAVILQSQWGLSESESDWISSVVFLGSLTGTLVLTPLGDKLGRRIIFAVTSATISFFGIVSAFCTTYPQILMVRFMVGFGIGGLTVPYDTLGEFMPNSRRGKNMLSTSFFWIAAALMVPVFAWMTLGRDTKDNVFSNDSSSGEGSWRSFVMLCSLPSIVSTALGICFVPESPRWLLTRGKHEKSLKILREAAAKNGKDPYLAFPEGVRLVDHNNVSSKKRIENDESSMYAENDENNDSMGDGIQRDNTIRENIHGDEMNKHNEFAMASTSDRLCVMCSNPKWRKMSFLVGGQWYGLTFMYYGAIMAVSIVFSNIQKDDNDGDSNNGQNFSFDYEAIFIASSAEIVGLTLAILMVDRVGRVPTQVWSYSLGGFCLLLLGILDFYMGPDFPNGIDQEGEESQRGYLIVFAFLSRMFIMAATSITWLHTAELLPTRFRATGHGLANALGRVGGITCPFIVSRENSLRTIGVVMFSVSIVTSICVKNLPETVGKALGNFDDSDSLNEPPQGQHSHHQISAAGKEVPDDDGAQKTTGRKLDGDDPTDDEIDERIIASFEII